MANFGVPRKFISHHDLLCVSFFLNLVFCTRIALEQICFQRGKLTVDCGQVLQVHISQMDLISVQCLGLICLVLLRSQPDQASARADSAIFGFSNSSFTKFSGFVSLAGEASLVSISGAVRFLRAQRVYLPLEFEVRRKRGVEKGAMAAEMSFRATYLSCVFYCMEDEFKQIITKLLTAEYYINFYSVFPTNLGSYFYLIQTHCNFT